MKHLWTKTDQLKQLAGQQETPWSFSQSWNKTVIDHSSKQQSNLYHTKAVPGLSPALTMQASPLSSVSNVSERQPPFTALPAVTETVSYGLQQLRACWQSISTTTRNNWLGSHHQVWKRNQSFLLSQTLWSGVKNESSPLRQQSSILWVLTIPVTRNGLIIGPEGLRFRLGKNRKCMFFFFFLIRHWFPSRWFLIPFDLTVQKSMWFYESRVYKIFWKTKINTPPKLWKNGKGHGEPDTIKLEQRWKWQTDTNNQDFIWNYCHQPSQYIETVTVPARNIC